MTGAVVALGAVFVRKHVALGGTGREMRDALGHIGRPS